MARRAGALLRALLPRPHTMLFTLLCLMLPLCSGFGISTAIVVGVRFAMEKHASSGGSDTDSSFEADDGSQPVTPSISDGFSGIGSRDFYTFVGAPAPSTVELTSVKTVQHACRQEGTGCAS